jgi:hypothetical protein
VDVARLLLEPAQDDEVDELDRGRVVARGGELDVLGLVLDADLELGRVDLAEQLVDLLRARVEQGFAGRSDRRGVREHRPDVTARQTLQVVEQEHVERVADRDGQDVAVLRERQDAVLHDRFLRKRRDGLRIGLDARQVDRRHAGRAAQGLEQRRFGQDPLLEQRRDRRAAAFARRRPVLVRDEVRVD